MAIFCRFSIGSMIDYSCKVNKSFLMANLLNKSGILSDFDEDALEQAHEASQNFFIMGILLTRKKNFVTLQSQTASQTTPVGRGS